MADRIAVLDRGRVVQVGEPEALYEAPETLFVARFLGESNLFTGRLELADGHAFLVDGDVRWVVDLEQARERGLVHGGRATAVVRPERTLVAPRPPASAPPNLASGVVAELVYLGASRKVVVDLERGGTVQARLDSHDDRPFASGDPVVVGWEPKAAALVAGGERPSEDDLTGK